MNDDSRLAHVAFQDPAEYSRALFKALADWPDHDRAKLARVFSERGQEAAALAVERIGRL